MTKKLLGVGIIGTGIGLRQVAPGFIKTGKAKLSGVAGSSISRVQELTKDFEVGFVTDNYLEICESEDVDIICVTTPNEFHEEHMKVALGTGKHVFLEKPVGVDMEETQKIASYNNSEDRMVIVGHQLRFNPYIAKMKELIASGEIGRVYHLSLSQTSKSFANRSMPWIWSFDEQKGGGVRLAIGVHLIDTVRFLLGQEAQMINASMDPVFKVRTPQDSQPRECRASNFYLATANFPDATVDMSTTLTAGTGNTFRIVARGEEGDLIFDLQNKLQKWVDGKPTAVLDEKVDVFYNNLKGPSIFWDSFTYYAQAIADAIAEGKNVVESASDVGDALKNIAVLDAAQISHQQKTREKINY